MEKVSDEQYAQGTPWPPIHGSEASAYALEYLKSLVKTSKSAAGHRLYSPEARGRAQVTRPVPTLI